MSPYTPTGYTGKLMVGVAQRLDDLGLAVYRENGPYAAGERGVYFDASPASSDGETAATCVIAPYAAFGDGLAVERTRVQIRAKHPGWGKLQIRDWLDAVRAAFPDEQRLTLAGLDFDRVRQVSVMFMSEPGGAEVPETVQNFEVRGNRYH